MEGSAREEIGRLTTEGLGEGYRLAHEARRAIRSRYEDWMIVIAIAGLLGWGAILLATVMSGRLLPGAWALALSAAVVAVAYTPALILCRRHFAARLAEQDRWIARLRTTRERGRDDAASTFDLLVEVSHQVPLWLSIKQKDRFRGHPFLTTVLFISGASTVYTAVLALANLEESSLVYLLMVLTPLATVFIASALAEASAVRREREIALARWRERVERSRRAMEESLEGL